MAEGSFLDYIFEFSSADNSYFTTLTFFTLFGSLQIVMPLIRDGGLRLFDPHRTAISLYSKRVIGWKMRDDIQAISNKETSENFLLKKLILGGDAETYQIFKDALREDGDEVAIEKLDHLEDKSHSGKRY